MSETVSRAVVIVGLIALMTGAYVLISGGSAANGITANAKFEPKKPPQFSSTMMEGSMI